MSPVEAVAPLNKREQITVCFACFLGVALFGGFVWYCIDLISRPASQADVDRFRRVFEISLTQDQTTSDFQQKYPVIHQLQQKAVDGLRWGLVADSEKYDQLIANLRTQQAALISQSQPTDRGITAAKQGVDELTTQIDAAKKEQEIIQARWEESYSLAILCRFSDGGASSFETARYKYREWLKKQGSSSH